MFGKTAAAAGMGWLWNFITPGLNKSVVFSTCGKITVFKRDGQSCVILPYLDCLDCVNWGCKVLEERFPKGRRGPGQNTRGEERGRSEGRDGRNSRKWKVKNKAEE